MKNCGNCAQETERLSQLGLFTRGSIERVSSRRSCVSAGKDEQLCKDRDGERHRENNTVQNSGILLPTRKTL
jgi:hypothetical protein